MLKHYLEKLQVSVNLGDSREESYYNHLERLVFQNNNLKTTK